ncbi:flagellar hook-length control protein FliK [Denitromonas sp.]|uniref:flagellar hook-length control protein FliK n=1 Tax=Denitromonas sp. TaxID=2734609 RepID=UPI002AFEEB31|nr:flagellar hook-length control protein FliK [Denitromonas sp.]
MNPPSSPCSRPAPCRRSCPSTARATVSARSSRKPCPTAPSRPWSNGRTIKLALPQAAQAGERLELVVARSSPRAVLANPAPAAPGDSAARAALSPTGRLISFLLTGQPAPETPAIARGQPLQAASGPINAAALAAALRQGISESGLFYESHLARWTAGKLPTEALLREPQARLPLTQGGSTQGPGAPAQGHTAPPAADAISASRTANTTQAVAPVRADAIPDRLLPVMHQQLDALATHHYSWHGQAWPGQPMELEIEDPHGDGEHDDADDATWKTTLRLSLPALGGVEARIALDAGGVRIHLSADDSTTTAVLHEQRGGLADALARANLTLKELQVSQGHEHTAR